MDPRNQPVKKLKTRVINVKSIDANTLAVKLGNVRIANMILLGMLSNTLDISESTWIECIRTACQKE